MGMSKLNDLVRGLKEKIFGREEQRQDVAPPAPMPMPETHDKAVPVTPKATPRTIQSRRQPHFVQIGFDFGTAYSKCVCRDLMTNKAWVHLPSNPASQELPFLIPSTLVIENNQLKHQAKIGVHYPHNGLNHLKLALEKVALKKWDDPALDSYRRVVVHTDRSRLTSLVEASAIYFLAGALGEVRRQVKHRLGGFGDHPDDYMAVNLALPVADAEKPAVNHLYHRVLCQAWVLADRLAGHPSIEMGDLEALLSETQGQVDQSVRDACFIYPEVSANVQGFVRSRASSEGIYLFSDTGAGTVDQGVFIFTRTNNSEQLAYLHGSVLPLGSSCIERYAAEGSGGGFDWTHLERLRQEKESGGTSPALEAARKTLAQELDRGTTRTLALSRKKLYRADQIKDIRVTFGGGGHCDNPYKRGTMAPFSGNLFAQTIKPDIVGLPTPIDLELSPSAKRWLPRLSVAYGLSFEKSELARFTYPVDIQTPSPEELWRPKSRHIEAATKDDC
jgi:hypothetical protein